MFRARNNVVHWPAAPMGRQRVGGQRLCGDLPRPMRSGQFDQFCIDPAPRRWVDLGQPMADPKPSHA